MYHVLVMTTVHLVHDGLYLVICISYEVFGLDLHSRTTRGVKLARDPSKENKEKILTNTLSGEKYQCDCHSVVCNKG